MAGLACPPLSPAQDRASDHSLSVPVLDPPSMEKPPVADGIVDRYLLNPRGDVNGLLLRDGSQMHVTLRARKTSRRQSSPAITYVCMGAVCLIHHS